MPEPLKLQINGNLRSFPDLASPTPLSDLIAQLNLQGDRIAVEHNGEIAPRTTWAERLVRQDDRLEIVHFVGGGRG